MQTIKLPLHYAECAIRFNDKHKKFDFFSKPICKIVDIIMRIVFIYNIDEKANKHKASKSPHPF